MASPATIWKPRDPEHVRHFAAYLKPFQRASGSRLFDDPTVTTETVQAWILTLGDVPADVLEEARGRVLAEGITWMPRPGDVKRHCVAIVGERIRALGIEAATVISACERCHGSTWTDVELDGYTRVVRCGCFAESMRLMEGAPKALPMPPKERDEREDGAA